jgi:hypothetical protein
LAAALATMGIGMPQRPEIITSEEGSIYTFYFHDASDDGLYITKDLVQAWASDNWELENPDHPFAYIKTAFKNREALLDLTKQFKHLLLVKSKGKMRLIPRDLPDDQAKVLLTL